MNKFRISAIACVDALGGIGCNNKIPWQCPIDMKWFVSKTTAQMNTPTGAQSTYPARVLPDKNNMPILIMGRKTYESINRPLPGRFNLVISSANATIAPELVNSLKYVKTFDEAINYSKELFRSNPDREIIVIGGASVYLAALNSNYLRKIYLSQMMDLNMGCDTFMFGDADTTNVHLERINSKFTLAKYESHDAVVRMHGKPGKLKTQLIMKEYIMDPNPEEEKYLRLLNKIVSLRDVSAPNQNRTAVRTFSVFSKKLKFSLRNTTTSNTVPAKILPLLTTKRMPYRTICNELIWFMRGEPHIKFLRERNVKIWDRNTTEEFLRKQNLDYAEGETGPIYGVQWRNWGGVDQLAQLIYNIINDPYSRRHIISAWNVTDLPKMCLPPCHLMSIWKVMPDENGTPAYLSCSVLMRSADMFLGVPFNIASYATFAHLIAGICGLRADKLAVDMVDCHVYENHVDQCVEQISREANKFPELEFGVHLEQHIDNFRRSEKRIEDINALLNEVSNISADNFALNNYQCYETISAQMAV